MLCTHFIHFLSGSAPKRPSLTQGTLAFTRVSSPPKSDELMPPPKRPHRDQIKASAGTAAGGKEKLWIEAHAPTCEADLAIHPKKLSELKDWLQLYGTSTCRRGLTSDGIRGNI